MYPWSTCDPNFCFLEALTGVTAELVMEKAFQDARDESFWSQRCSYTFGKIKSANLGCCSATNWGLPQQTSDCHCRTLCWRCACDDVCEDKARLYSSNDAYLRCSRILRVIRSDCFPSLLCLPTSDATFLHML